MPQHTISRLYFFSRQDVNGISIQHLIKFLHAIFSSFDNSSKYFPSMPNETAMCLILIRHLFSHCAIWYLRNVIECYWADYLTMSITITLASKIKLQLLENL